MSLSPAHGSAPRDRRPALTQGERGAGPAAPGRAVYRRWGVVLGLAMVPLLASAASAFWHCFSSATLRHDFWKSAECWFFHVGVASWCICLVGLRGRLLHALYVFGHEWTHALAALCCGGRLLRWPVISSEGGHVVTDRSNVFITLAPYVVPFYSVLAAVLFGGAGLLWRLPEGALWLLYALLGFTWAFHATFTLRMMRIHQPDFEKWGRFFSFVAIALANTCLLCALLVLASPNVSAAMVFRVWLEQAAAAGNALSRFFGA